MLQISVFIFFQWCPYLIVSITIKVIISLTASQVNTALCFNDKLGSSCLHLKQQKPVCRWISNHFSPRCTARNRARLTFTHLWRLHSLAWQGLRLNQAQMITGTASEKERKASPLPLSPVNHPPASDRNAILFSVPKLRPEGKYCTVEQTRSNWWLLTGILQDSAWPGVLYNNTLTQTHKAQFLLFIH